ncbi:MAG: substrate-binding domain-containing protein, partial [Gammaproteobacteria bacterium]|nr:substrate-binding domain-containing protein [Gammaproteobacteria bacterium]
MRRFITLILCLFSFSHTVFAVENHEVIMRLHGSNTIGAKLGPELVKSWMQAQGYTDIRSKMQVAQELLITAKNKYAQDIAVEIKAHGSGTGFKSLAKKANDIAMASRPIKAKEINKLTALGDLTKMGSEFVIGLDGIAVIVHKNNPISELKKTTIRKIFAGEIIDWKQIDQRYKGRIHVYARDDKSGTYDTFKALVLGMK